MLMVAYSPEAKRLALQRELQHIGGVPESRGWLFWWLGRRGYWGRKIGAQVRAELGCSRRSPEGRAVKWAMGRIATVKTTPFQITTANNGTSIKMLGIRVEASDEGGLVFVGSNPVGENMVALESLIHTAVVEGASMPVVELGELRRLGVPASVLSSKERNADQLAFK